MTSTSTSTVAAGATAAPATAAPATAAPETAAELPALSVTKIADGLVRPTYLTHSADGAGRLYVLEQPGRIRVIEDGQLRAQPFLDITDRVGSSANEQGLLSIAFSPNYSQDRALYANYTDRRGATTVSRFTASADGQTADPGSEQVLLKVDQPYPNHNGGQIQFGPDGMLYIGMGDGGSAGDPQDFAQNVRSLLGKMLRIDVGRPDAGRGLAYSIPADNPAAFGAEAAPEIWASGLRNPWRFSFDRNTGDLYIGDVGQNTVEEINFQPASSAGGENYGWKLREGFRPYAGGGDSPAFTDPIHEYDRDQGCSVTGGYVYRGGAMPALDGVYVYADYCSGNVWGLRRDASGNWINQALTQIPATISSFGEDEAGELYVLDHGNGAVYKIGPG